MLSRKLLASGRQCNAIQRSFSSKSAAKRALSKKQLDGKNAKPTTPLPPPPAAAPTVERSGGPGSMMPLVGFVGLLGAAGVYVFYNNMTNPEFGQTKQAGSTTTSVVEESKANAVKESEESKEDPLPTAVSSDEQSEVPAVIEEVVNKVVQIGTLPAGTRLAAAEPVKDHPVDGNRVAMDVPKKEATPESAIAELKPIIDDDESSRTLIMARKALRSSLDESLLEDLDQLSLTELRVRIVKLAAELEERTKWEAVRLKEFLAMKEKETGEKYMEVMQKQRLDMEAELSRKLREQEDALQRQTNQIIQQKDSSVQAVVQAATDAAEKQHEADLASAKERLETEIGAKAEAEYAQKLTEAKAGFAKELEEKMSTVDELAAKIQQLESALSVSRTFEMGSLQAHKMSAAALALAEKLETSHAAGKEIASLAGAAADNSVVAAALGSIPVSSAKVGIPTLAELQTGFSDVAKKTRQAALVPEGRSGLEGQLMGLLFSTIKYAPNPEDSAPNDSKDAAEYVLARAGRHVALGELERAIEQLDKLEGQAAFTIKDWKQAALDRVATDKALHVIKMECALLNESMSGGSA